MCLNSVGVIWFDFCVWNNWCPLFDLYILLRFCRIFHLSSDLIQPEQAYYLQPVQPGSSRNATSICPVDFSFGGDHLWDCFSVSSSETFNAILYVLVCMVCFPNSPTPCWKFLCPLYATCCVNWIIVFGCCPSVKCFSLEINCNALSMFSLCLYFARLGSLLDFNLVPFCY